MSKREENFGRVRVNDPGPRELEWRDALRRYVESGLTVRDFCRRERLAESLFYYWKREIARRDLGLKAPTRNGRAKPRRPRHAATKHGFVPLNVCRVELTHAPLELVLTDGRCVRIGGDFDESVLKKLLGTLEATR
jgi:transposase-like protein